MEKVESDGGIWQYIYSLFKQMDQQQLKQLEKEKVDDLDGMDVYDLNSKQKKDKKHKKDKWKKVDYGDDILNYEIKGDGNNVSGGLKQSIALSRAFLKKDAKIIICDESLNSMDMVKKNKHIYPNLFEFVNKNNMTLIMISHDILECFAHLDHVVVMEKGRLHNQGTHQYLFDESNLYRSLC